MRLAVEADLAQEEEEKEVEGLELGIEIFRTQVVEVETVTIHRLVPKEEVQNFQVIETIQAIEFTLTSILV